MRIVVALIFSMFAANAAHAGIVVWMNEEMPEDRYTSKANSRTGGTRHLSYFDLAFPPQPASDADDAVWEDLRKEVAEGKRRWEDFEVEYGIAKSLDEQLAKIDVIRSERDLDELVEALLFQGAAVQVAFEPAEFKDGKRAKPFRFDRTGGVGNRPWSEAYALEPEREPLASDVADGATFPQLIEEFAQLEERPTGTLTLATVDKNAKIVVDGEEVEGSELTLAPGRHWIHVVRGKNISGRQVLVVEEGRTTTMEPTVSVDDLKAAADRVAQGTTTGFPESVRGALEQLAGHYGGQVFVGVVVDGRTEVLPYAHGAALLKQRKFTAVAAGEIGAGVMASSVFDGSGGNQTFAGAAIGNLGLEFAFYNFAVVTGSDMAITPGHTITHGKANSTENVDTSVFLQPYVGAGLYVLRPTGRRTTMLVSGHYSWLHPAHHAVGGRVSMGVPIEPTGGSWLRLTVGGSGAPSSIWGATDSMFQLYARTGIATRF